MVPDRGEVRAMSNVDLRVSGHTGKGNKSSSHWDINVSIDEVDARYKDYDKEGELKLRV